LITLKSNNLLYEKQAGFTPGDSTINQLVIINDTMLNAFENGKEVRHKYRVWHLIHELKSMGVTGKLIDWLRS
jgi:hypothetical protein